jgi:hypothetical protein
MNNDITTTNGDVFTQAETEALARLIYKRLGCDEGVATSAWCRLLGNYCTIAEFLALVRPETQPYSVLLLYPDYIGDYPETFYTHVRAANVTEAIAGARAECMAANRLPADEEGEAACQIADPDDLLVLLVIVGHLADAQLLEVLDRSRI